MLNPSVTPGFEFQLQPRTDNPGVKLGTTIEFAIHRRLQVDDCGDCVGHAQWASLGRQM